MPDRIRDILVTFRDFLFGIVNKEFLIFLFFLVLSSVYWLMSVLNDTMEREIDVPIQLVGVPKNVIVIGDSVTTVKTVVRDKGYAIAMYLYGDKVSPVDIPFGNYTHEGDVLTLTSQELTKLIRPHLFGSSRIVSVKPAKLEIPFNTGHSKLVPVRLSGSVAASDNYAIARVEFQPDSVNIYASSHILDDINSVYTVKLDVSGVTDTITRIVSLKNVKGVKAYPGKVRMTVYPDIMTEAVSSVPITSINVPVGVVLKTFPSSVDVRYVVGTSQFKNLNDADFEVVADYQSTNDGTADKCQLRLVKSPSAARSPMLLTSEVDYLIEQ